MNYLVSLIGIGEVNVDEITGRKIKEYIATGKRNGYFKSEEGVYQVKDVKYVRPIKDGSPKNKGWTDKQMEEDRDYDDRLEAWANQTPDNKAKREIKTRIAPIFQRVKPQINIKELYSHLYKWFENNPEYPWCPIDVWLGYAFRELDVFPYYTKLVINHDRRVYRWLDEKNKVPQMEKYGVLFEPLAYTIGGDLDD